MNVVRRLLHPTRSNGVSGTEPKNNLILTGIFDEQYLSLDQLAKRFRSSGIDVADPGKSRGLKASKATRILAENGANMLKSPRGMGNVEMFLLKFVSGFWLLLLGAAVLCFLTYILKPEEKANLLAGIALVAVVIVMCVVEFWQEKSGRSIVGGFATLMPTECDVIRDGTEHKIQPTNIVLGDIVVVHSGAKVPADLRLIVRGTVTV